MVSIVVPIFNSQFFLSECIQSILSQTYSDFELILVDDGSTDESLQICLNYARRDNRIIIKTQPNRGASAARNAGIISAKGDWITFIDSDDYISPTFLEEFCSNIDDNYLDVIVSGFTKVYPNQKNKCFKFENDILSSLNYESFFSYSYWGYNCSKLYKSSLIKENSIFYDEKISFSEDKIFTLFALSFSKKIKLTDSVGYFYRISTNSISKQKYDINREIQCFQRIYYSGEHFSLITGRNYIFKYLDLYQYLIRCIKAIYNDQALHKGNRIRLLKSIKYISRAIFYRYSTVNEGLLYLTAKYRLWLLFDIIYRYSLKQAKKINLQ